MAAISKSSATIAGLYSIFVSLVIVLIYNFVVQGIVVPANVAFGAALIVLALLNAVAGVTSQDPDESLLRSFQLSLAVLWAGVGVYHVTEGTLVTGVTPAQALFAGYGAYLLIFIVYVIGALQHRCKFTAILALGFGLSCIFEIAALWRPLRNSAAAYYILLSLLVLYGFMARILAKFRNRKEVKKPEVVLVGPHNSRDYVPLGHAMNTLAFAVFAGHVTRVFPSSSTEFHWVLVAGAAQTLAALVAVRRGDSFNGSYFLLYGMFWLANAFNMAVEYVTGAVLLPLIAVYVIYIITFFIIAVVSLTREIYQFLQNLAICIFCIAICVDGYQGNFIGGMGWVCFILSLYGLLAHMTRIKSGSFKLPLGVRLFEAKGLKTFMVNRCRCFASCLYGKLRESGRDNRLFSRDFMLGYSKYLDLDTACFALNAVSALAILWVPNGLEVLPWVLGFGGLPQMIIGSIAFSRGLTFESCAFFTFASLWVIWGPARGFNVVTADNTVASAIGCVAFLVVGLLLFGLSLVINKAWSVLTFIFNLMVLSFLLTTLAIPGTNVFEIVIVILFVLVCIYCFLASALKAVWGHEVLPLGKPVLQISYLHSQGERAFWADARRASGVQAIADIMNRGGIVGIPTDVVYVLVAACKFPKSVERAYNTKKLAEDRPMSMWISRVDQVEAGRELFGELVWAFMSEVWPSTISLVLPKGPWLDSLGIGYAEKYIGRPDSIAVRMPDNTVTSYLLDQTGPVATSSANPTGEADTLHHLQVLAKLGLENCDGILCSGPSPENMASTVVDCRKLGQGGQLGFFRIGVVPKSKVEELLARAQEKHTVATSLPGSITNLSTRSSDSGMGGPEDNSNDNADNGEEKQVSDLEGGHDNPAYSSDAYEYPDEEQGRRYSRSDIPRSSLYSDPDSPAAPASPVSRTSSTAYQRTSALQRASRSGHASDDSVELASLRSDGNPYEPMSRVGSSLIQASRQIGGKQPGPCSEPHTRVNPLYSEISQKL